MIFREIQKAKEVQLALNKLGAVESTALHLCSPSDEVVKEVLKFLAALLWDGNSKVHVIN